tara:strand:+ start:669 stop:803 length:135 start_codon:yes stop_codon:yes gene_type:complete
MSTEERTAAALERIAEALERIVQIVEAETLTEEAGAEWFRNENS